MTLHPFLRCRAGQQNESWLFSLRQREERQPRHWARCRARQQNQCCFCFDQTINASGIFPLAFLSFLRLVGCNPAKKAPLCKGSCRPAPTEGLRCSVTLPRLGREKGRGSPVSGRPDSLCLSSYNLPGAGAQYDCPGTGPEITRRQCRKSLKRISGSLHRSEGSGPPGLEMGRKFVYNIIRKDSMSVGWEV